MTISSTDAEILITIKALENFKLFVILATEFILRIDCQAIVSFYHKNSENKLSTNGWLTLVDYIIGNGF